MTNYKLNSFLADFGNIFHIERTVSNKLIDVTSNTVLLKQRGWRIYKRRNEKYEFKEDTQYHLYPTVRSIQH